MFTYVACRPSAKPKERIENFKERDLRFIYEQELDKTGLQHDMVDGGFKDLPRRVTSEELLRDKALKFQNMLDIRKVLFQLFKIF